MTGNPQQCETFHYY